MDVVKDSSETAVFPSSVDELFEIRRFWGGGAGCRQRNHIAYHSELRP